MRRDLHLRRAGQHQRRAVGAGGVLLESTRAACRSPCCGRRARGRAGSPPERRDGRARRARRAPRAGSSPMPITADGCSARPARVETSVCLFGRQEQVAGRASEELLEDVEVDRRDLLRRSAAARRGRRPAAGRRTRGSSGTSRTARGRTPWPARPKVIEQRRGRRARSRETTAPAARARVRPSNTSSLRSANAFRRRGRADRKPEHAHAAVPRLAGGRRVRPRSRSRAAQVVRTVMSWRATAARRARGSALRSRRRCPAPYRWTTKASFTRRSGAGGASCAQAGGLDGQLLDAGEQHLVHAALPLEVVAAVLEQPAEHRHQQAAFDEHDERAGRAVRCEW